MNKSAIKAFAVWARKKLINDIRTKAGMVGITEKGVMEPLSSSTGQIQYFDIGTNEPYALTGKDIRGREKLVAGLRQEEEQSDYGTAYSNLLENTASAWFNRLIALRFMEVNDYFVDHLRILSSAEPGKQDPDLVTSPFESDLDFKEEERRQIMEWKMNHEEDILFQHLFIRKCNVLNRVLPGLFEDENDDTEFLMSLSFIEKDGVVYHLIHDIPEEDWLDGVQIIGWIYQYYNSELKDETFDLLKKNIKITKERIPSATQLFTPDWIVRYMVENSLGRLWLEGHPDRELREGWIYYLDDAEQEPEVQTQLEEIRKGYRKLSPEDLKFIDPCMGSGHILVYAFDVLMLIYDKCGYTKKEAVQSIINNNLYGLDIDDRAYQLAYFAVMMKARQYSRQILKSRAKPHLHSIQESNLVNRDHLRFFGFGMDRDEQETALNQMENLLDIFKDAKEYGSILSVEGFDWELLNRFVSDRVEGEQISLFTFGLEETAKRLKVLVEIGEVMGQKYDVTCTNPPYMGGSNASYKLYVYMQNEFPVSKNDLYAVFMEKCEKMLKPNAFKAIITQHSWMFLATFQELRKQLFNTEVINMIHLGAHAFEEITGEIVQTCAFVQRNRRQIMYKGTYCRLVEVNSAKNKEIAFFDNSLRYIQSLYNMSLLPGHILAYWASSAMFKNFKSSKMGELFDVKSGLSTGDNEKFVRYWYEVADTDFVRDNSDKRKWVPYNKGGGICKWFGINIFIVLWGNEGEYIKKYGKGVFRNQLFYFKEGITWSGIASVGGSFRFCPPGYIFDSNKGPMIFKKCMKLQYALGLLNSKVAQVMINMLNPTISLQIGDILSVPVIYDNDILNKVIITVDTNIEIARADWNDYEISWDFKTNPLVILRALELGGNVNGGKICQLDSIFNTWEQECENRFLQLKSNEEALNRIFINLYGLQDELTPEVEDKDITVRKADLQRDIRSLISYAVGCMFGRYSLEIPGLVYAGGQWPPYEKAIEARKKNHPQADPDAGSWTDAYGLFVPDLDNCVPILDSDYFSDDIVGRFVEFIRIVYGEETLEENLSFIAEALGGRGTTSREMIRHYFLKDFYRDHLRIYQKRPIYWLFDSGKQDGFKALIYMHRYDEDTIGRVRVEYLHKAQERYENEVRVIDLMQEHISDLRQRAAGEKRKEKLIRQIKETKEYDEKIGHLALERIAIDLDDGVKVNYAKVQRDRNGDAYQILAPVK